MKLIKNYAPGSKADVLQTVAVGAVCLVPLPALVIFLVIIGGPAGFFAGLLLGLWGAFVGKHLVDACRDGAAAYGYAKASNAWGRK